MAEVEKQKRQVKPGHRRVVVTVAEEQYNKLVELSQREMREPNNMLSFMLKNRIDGMLADYQE